MSLRRDTTFDKEHISEHIEVSIFAVCVSSDGDRIMGQAVAKHPDKNSVSDDDLSATDASIVSKNIKTRLPPVAVD